MYSLRTATKADLDFLYALKKETLGSYIQKIWGWDEVYQRNDLIEGLLSYENYIILVQGEDAGFLQINYHGLFLYIVELQMLPKFQGQGLGSQILRNLILKAKKDSKKIRIGCFKENNGAQKLYLNLGFRKIYETETHLVFELLEF